MLIDSIEITSAVRTKSEEISEIAEIKKTEAIKQNEISDLIDTCDYFDKARIVAEQANVKNRLDQMQIAKIEAEKKLNLENCKGMTDTEKIIGRFAVEETRILNQMSNLKAFDAIVERKNAMCLEKLAVAENELGKILQKETQKVQKVQENGRGLAQQSENKIRMSALKRLEARLKDHLSNLKKDEAMFGMILTEIKLREDEIVLRSVSPHLTPGLRECARIELVKILKKEGVVKNGKSQVLLQQAVKTNEISEMMMQEANTINFEDSKIELAAVKAEQAQRTKDVANLMLEQAFVENKLATLKFDESKCKRQTFNLQNSSALFKNSLGEGPQLLKEKLMNIKKLELNGEMQITRLLSRQAQKLHEIAILQKAAVYAEKQIANNILHKAMFINIIAKSINY